MKPVSRRTLDWIYSAVGSRPRVLHSAKSRVLRASYSSPPRNSKTHSRTKRFSLSPGLRLFLEDRVFRFLRKGSWVSSPWVSEISALAKIYNNLVGAGSNYHAHSFFPPKLLLAVVLLSWGYVIYASTVVAQRQLRKKYPDKIFRMNENL